MKEPKNTPESAQEHIAAEATMMNLQCRHSALSEVER